jgi:hypothetical protein
MSASVPHLSSFFIIVITFDEEHTHNIGLFYLPLLAAVESVQKSSDSDSSIFKTSNSDSSIFKTPTPTPS